MNTPRPRARIIVRARDPELRRQIAERLSGLADVSLQPEGDLQEAADGALPEGADAVLMDAQDAVPLTPREKEVLALMAEGLANKEIGARIGVSMHTAKFHVESLLRKLAVVNRAEAVKEGIRRGVIGV